MPKADIGEFIEYVRQTYYKQKTSHTLAEGQEDLEPSDLSDEDTFKRQYGKLSGQQRSNLKRYIRELRALQSLLPKTHDCVNNPKKSRKLKGHLPVKKNRLENDRRMVEMELVGIKAPLPIDHEKISAH